MLEQVNMLNSILADLKKINKIYSWQIDMMKDQNLDFYLKIVIQIDGKTRIIQIGITRFNLKFWIMNITVTIDLFIESYKIGLINEDSGA